MRRTLASLTVAALLAGAGLAAGAAADNPLLPVDGGTVVEQCYADGSSELDDPGYKFCRSLQSIVWGAAAACRTPERTAPDATRPDYCAVFDGREIGEAEMAAYEKSWVHQALTLQRGLDQAAPFWEEQLPHTHNSFNAAAYSIPTDGSLPSYYATLTNQDPNQVYTITDQLRMDIRAIEMDAHWVPSPYGTADTRGYWPTMCHGSGEDPTGEGPAVHIGCTYDRPLQDGLHELRTWLDAHKNDVVLLYLENQLFSGGPVASEELAHNTTASIIKDQLGDLVYQPPAAKSGTCAPMPYNRSRAELLAAKKQVLIVGNCGPGNWNQWVFTRGPSWDESGDPTTYDEADCAKDEAARDKHTSFRRYYEESPWLEAMTDATQVLTAATTARMVRCGANIIGFDQLEPFDGRLAAMVWSWAKGQPAATGDCAMQGWDGRFRTAGCGTRLRFACVDDDLDWHVTHARGTWSRGGAACRHEFPGSTFGVPANGYRNALLAAAHGRKAGNVWLDYRKVGGQWKANA